MIYLLLLFFGFTTGVTAVLLILWSQFQKAHAREKNASAELGQIKQRWEELEAKRQALDLNEKAFMTDSAAFTAENARQREQIASKQKQLDAAQLGFNARVISYKDLQSENVLLKKDLQNIDVNLNKLGIDGDIQTRRQDQLDERSTELGKRYLNETVKYVTSSIGPSNFAACKQRLLNVIQWVREIGFIVPPEQEGKLITDLKTGFEKAVKEQFEREEQARIKAQIYEEQKLAREIDRELKQLDRERAAIQAALDRALTEAAGKHSEEIERLRARLAEAEEKSKRAMSMAQQTKAGNVYIISNLGSFGENIFKIGMTRRLEPLDRINELGSASVPFPFDVHAMIHCDDAPALENALHREFHKLRINKVNPRKEFFKVDMETILKIVRQKCGDVTFISDPERSVYRQSMTMSDEDATFIEQTYDALGADEEDVAVTDDI